MESWFENTVAGVYTAAQEKRFFEQNADVSGNAVAVQIGLSGFRPSEKIIAVPDDVGMESFSMAWQSRSLDVLLLPHTHEYSAFPLLTLTEAARVLKSGGRLILTGFNPFSLWAFSGWFDGNRLPQRKNCFSLRQIKQQLHALGFDIEYGKFMAYVPPVETEKSLDFWRFMDKAGDRWWPQCAAVYGLVLIKRQAGVTPLPEWEGLLQEEQVVLGTARVRGC